MPIAFPLRRSSSTLTGRRYAADRHGSARPRAWDDSSRRPAVRPARSPRPRQLRRHLCRRTTAWGLPPHRRRCARSSRVRGRGGADAGPADRRLLDGLRFGLRRLRPFHDFSDRHAGDRPAGDVRPGAAAPVRLRHRGWLALLEQCRSYGGSCGCYDNSDFYLDGDFTTTTSAGTGILITVARRRTPIAIDLGVRGVRHDRVKYVPAGGLSDTSDGTFSAQRVETPVELRVFQIGVSIGIR